MSHPYRLAARVLRNEAERQYPKPDVTIREGDLVEVFDHRGGFWRVGYLVHDGRKWRCVETQAKRLKVAKDQVRAIQ